MPRWTTARAVSGEADLRSSKASPTLSPEKERTGRVAAEQVMEVSEWNCLSEGFTAAMDRPKGFRAEKREEEKNESEVGDAVEVAIGVSE